MVESVEIRGKTYIDIIGLNDLLRKEGYPEIELMSNKTSEKVSWKFRK